MTEPIYPEMPQHGLVVLIGPSGAGKSTLARTWPASQVLSLDAPREVVSDDFSIKFSSLSRRTSKTVLLCEPGGGAVWRRLATVVVGSAFTMSGSQRPSPPPAPMGYEGANRCARRARRPRDGRRLPYRTRRTPVPCAVQLVHRRCAGGPTSCAPSATRGAPSGTLRSPITPPEARRPPTGRSRRTVETASLPAPNPDHCLGRFYQVRGPGPGSL